MTEFRKNKNGRAYPIKGATKKPQKMIPATELKLLKAKADKAHIHGLMWAGYALSLADDIRLKDLDRAVNKYGKQEATDELLYMLSKNQNNPRKSKVIKSDLSYLKYGKFEED